MLLHILQYLANASVFVKLTDVHMLSIQTCSR